MLECMAFMALAGLAATDTDPPTASPTWSVANLRNNPDASMPAHDEYTTDPKASRIAAEAHFKKTVIEFTKTAKADHFMTYGVKKRHNMLLVHDSLKPIAEQA
jgi:hypothetical protein